MRAQPCFTCVSDRPIGPTIWSFAVVASILSLLLVPDQVANAGPVGFPGPLFVLDNALGEERVLRIGSAGGTSVSEEISTAQIENATGETEVDLFSGMAFDASDNMYFIDNFSGSILKYDWFSANPTLTQHVELSDITGAQGGAGGFPTGIAFSSGSLFVTDRVTDVVLEVDPDTPNTVSVHTTTSSFTSLMGITSVDLGLPVAANGSLYVASDASPDAIFDVDPTMDNTVSVIANSGFTDLDKFLTVAPNGDIIVFDDGTDDLLRVTTAGSVLVQRELESGRC